jgi:hypothetical protein
MCTIIYRSRGKGRRKAPRQRARGIPTKTNKLREADVVVLEKKNLVCEANSCRAPLRMFVLRQTFSHNTPS